MNKRKLRSVYRKYLFSYSFDVLEPVKPKPSQNAIRQPALTVPALKK